MSARSRPWPVKTRLAVFDIDGTLTDSVAVHQQAFRDALERANLAPYDGDFDSYAHHTDSHISGTIFRKHHGRDMTEGEQDRFERDLHALILERLAGGPFPEIPGARAFVERLLWSTPYAVAYATGSFRLPALHKLAAGFPHQDGALLFACNRQPVREEILREAILACSRAYQVPGFVHVISFGDGRWDLEAAQNVGLGFVGIGRRGAHLFQGSECLARADDFERLEVDLP